MGTVYILQSKLNGRYYIGSTINLDRRLNEHFAGPFDLRFSQNFETIEEARKIELKLKKLKRRDIIERIVRDQKIIMDS